LSSNAESRDATMTLSLRPLDNGRFAELCGEHHANIRMLEGELGVGISQHGAEFVIEGSEQAIEQAGRTLERLYQLTGNGTLLDEQAIFQTIQGSSSGDLDESGVAEQFTTPRRVVGGRTKNQRTYVQAICENDIVFGVGPAGTGKTYLAVAGAVMALSQGEVDRIVLVRPAVEAGERLGFLPGDIGQKVDPYLRPLYDALYELMGPEKVGRLMGKGVIELAPLAYMRGRTLSDAFVILDEAQNTTVPQMKMLLTRIGFGSRAIVTGDLSQIDLPAGTTSGLRHAVDILSDVSGISLCRFTGHDIVRHPLVQRIVEAYDSDE
jgi:phosphate starvation-inducible PhoH-like protein